MGSRFAIQPGDGGNPALLIQGFDGESQQAPWFTVGGTMNPKQVLKAVPRGPILIEVDTTQGGTADVYLGEFPDLQSLVDAVGHDMTLGTSVPSNYPDALSVPNGVKTSKVFTPSYDFLVIAAVITGIAPVTVYPVGIVERGPSSIILAADGPDYSF